MYQLAPLTSPTLQLPALVTAAGDKAQKRFLEFFAANIRNPHTRRAYIRAVTEFLAWCHQNGLESLIEIEPLHVATWIEIQVQAGCAAPSVKQRLAALRHLFDWLVVGQIVPTNPAASVRGPQHIVKGGKTPVLDPAEARTLLDSIDISTHAGLRDRAVGSHLGVRISNFVPKKPSNVRISTKNILTFDGSSRRLRIKPDRLVRALSTRR
jgi:integrase/recombinase XerC